MEHSDSFPAAPCRAMGQRPVPLGFRSRPEISNSLSVRRNRELLRSNERRLLPGRPCHRLPGDNKERESLARGQPLKIGRAHSIFPTFFFVPLRNLATSRQLRFSGVASRPRLSFRYRNRDRHFSRPRLFIFQTGFMNAPGDRLCRSFN